MGIFDKDIGGIGEASSLGPAPKSNVAATVVGAGIDILDTIGREKVKGETQTNIDSILSQREATLTEPAVKEALDLAQSFTGETEDEELFFDDPVLKDAKRDYAKVERALKGGKISAADAKLRIDAYTKGMLTRHPFYSAEIRKIVQETTGISGFGSLYARQLLGDGEKAKLSTAERNARSIDKEGAKDGFLIENARQRQVYLNYKANERGIQEAKRQSVNISATNKTDKEGLLIDFNQYEQDLTSNLSVRMEQISDLMIKIEGQVGPGGLDAGKSAKLEELHGRIQPTCS